MGGKGISAIIMKLTIKKIALSAILLADVFFVFAQKNLLDTGVYRRWPQTGAASISGNGRYIAYVITNPMFSPNQLVIREINSVWKTSFVSRWPLDTHVFTFDSRYAIFMRSVDTLEMIDLQTKRSNEINGVKTFNIQPMGHWIAYSVIAPIKQYILRNTLTGERVSIDSAERLELPKQGDVVYYWVNSVTRDSDRKSLYALDLANHLVKRLWAGTPSGNLVFSKDNQQVAFIGRVGDSAANDIWYHRAAAGSKVAGIGFDRLADRQNIKLVTLDGFEQSGRALWIMTQKDTVIPEIKKKNMVSLDVWSYTDPVLQSEQSPSALAPPQSHALLRLDSLNLIPITRENEAIVFKTTLYTLVRWSDPRRSISPEFFASWSPYTIDRYYLVSNQDGSRKPLPIPITVRYRAVLSPQGKYLIFVNMAGDYCSYATATGRVTDLTKNVTTDRPEIQIGNSFAKNKSRYVPDFLWTPNDGSFLVYDRYDIWELDPEGKKLPVNITNGYGNRNYIRFEVAVNYQHNEINADAQLILMAFNTQTKESGYFKVILGRSGDPIQLCMGPYRYYGAPTKAQNADLYLVGRMSAEESPNYFVTRDFRSFEPVTDIYPEKAYDWVTSELLSWKQADGTDLQGVLYKPQNFDPHKKYPLLFYCYQGLSDELNEYQTPGPSAGSGPTEYRLNAPYYTANGYLVFYPDIVKKAGAAGQSACDAVVSAVRYLSQRPYIDSTKLGLYGISFGGYETNYIITHSKLFAAACTNAGASDLVYKSGELFNLGNGGNEQEFVAFGQYDMGRYLWEDPELYLKASPVAYADKVSTPLLMMNNKRDPTVGFAQGVAFFTALRTLGKKAWLLQYDKGGHGMDLQNEPDDAIDFDVRLKQFYDFYLKGKSAPLWMLDGIPLYLKGTKTGLELDTTGRTPGVGLPQMRSQLEVNEKH